jgi:trehalose utilization protein
MMPIRATVWGENVHEQTNKVVARIYPDGMHNCIAAGLNEDPAIEAISVTLQDPEHGLADEVLQNTEVLLWWGHAAHGQVSDEIVDRVHKRVLEGMGLLVLHSGHYAKIFKRLMGTSCSLKWREAGERERLWVVNPGHETYPIYYDEKVRRVLKNAVKWAQPEGSRWIDSCPNVPADQAPNPVEVKGESLHKPGEEGFK